jgi:hypothetical protein
VGRRGAQGHRAGPGPAAAEQADAGRSPGNGEPVRSRPPNVQPVVPGTSVSAGGHRVWALCFPSTGRYGLALGTHAEGPQRRPSPPGGRPALQPDGHRQSSIRSELRPGAVRTARTSCRRACPLRAVMGALRRAGDGYQAAVLAPRTRGSPSRWRSRSLGTLRRRLGVHRPLRGLGAGRGRHGEPGLHA